MENEEKKTAEKKKSPGKRNKTSSDKRTKRVKMETTSSVYEGSMENLLVPTEFVTQVKKYINQLAAEKHMKDNGLSQNFPFPNL